MQLGANALESWKKSFLAVYWSYGVCLPVLHCLAACQVKIVSYLA